MYDFQKSIPHIMTKLFSGKTFMVRVKIGKTVVFVASEHARLIKYNS